MTANVRKVGAWNMELRDLAFEFPVVKNPLRVNMPMQTFICRPRKCAEHAISKTEFGSWSLFPFVFFYSTVLKESLPVILRNKHKIFDSAAPNDHFTS